MRNINFCDCTIDKAVSTEFNLTFKEKIEIAKILDRVRISAIELGEITSDMSDILLAKTVASTVKESVLSASVGLNPEAIKQVWESIRIAKKPRLQVRAATSISRMEYVYHKKPSDLIDSVRKVISGCRELCDDVEFVAEDATRADTDYLCSVLKAAIESGATEITLCDSAGTMFPKEVGAFIQTIRESVPESDTVSVGMSFSNNIHLAEACAIAAIGEKIDTVRTSALSNEYISLDRIADILKVKGEELDICIPVRITELKKAVDDIHRLTAPKKGTTPFEDGTRSTPVSVTFTSDTSFEDLISGMESLGYYLDENDSLRVWSAFSQIVKRKKQIDTRELELIIASETAQVPSVYELDHFVVTTGNAIDILAHVKLRKNGEILNGLSLGDGPIDAAFLAIEKITGHHYELDDFQIQAITEGREAMGQTIVKLRSNGKIYAGRGISTDIVASGIMAYLNALNKIAAEGTTV